MFFGIFRTSQILNSKEVKNQKQRISKVINPLLSYLLLQSFQGFRLNVGKSSYIIIFVLRLTTFQVRKIFWGGSVITSNLINSKTKQPYNQVKLVQISDTTVSNV